MSDKTKDLLKHTIHLLSDEYFEKTLMRKNHGEYMLDAYNFDQLPRYFFGLELHKLKTVFSRFNLRDIQPSLDTIDANEIMITVE